MGRTRPEPDILDQRRRHHRDLLAIGGLRDIDAGAVEYALGSAGRMRSGVEVRIIDENDCELPVGAVGELVMRTDCPWATSHGYAGNPIATAAISTHQSSSNESIEKIESIARNVVAARLARAARHCAKRPPPSSLAINPVSSTRADPANAGKR